MACGSPHEAPEIALARTRTLSAGLSMKFFFDILSSTVHKIPRYQLGRQYIVLLSFFIIVYMWRLSGFYWIPQVSSHLTNFALTGIAVLLLIGFRDFGQAHRWRKVIIICSMFVVANILVENLTIDGIPGMASTTANTADMYDAGFGSMAAIIIAGFYFLQRKLGRLRD